MGQVLIDAVAIDLKGALGNLLGNGRGHLVGIAASSVVPTGALAIRHRAPSQALIKLFELS